MKNSFKLEIKPLEKLHTQFGNVTLSNNEGYYKIVSRKEGYFDKRWHRVIFESFYGPIPKGCVIHHIDGDKTNNCILNLQLLTRADHNRQHNTIPNTNITGYYKVQKWKNDNVNQGFVWVYQNRFKDKHGKKVRKVISKVNFEDLEKEVKRQGLKWEALT